MLTQIEIDGFKTFKDFKVELAPFQVIVGPNGSGKSNLFDALQLLSRFASHDLRSAFQEMRGDADELFTLLSDGKRVDTIYIAVEMLVDKKVKDDLGQRANLKYSRLRYELEVTFRTDEYGLEQPYIMRETLKSIPPENDSWCQKYKLTAQSGWLLATTGQHAEFITTETIMSVKRPKNPLFTDITVRPTTILQLHYEGDEGKRPIDAEDTQRTVLSSINTTEHPHAFAAREELRSLRFLHLNPEELRKSSSVKASSFLSPEGGNLPATLTHMQAEDQFALTDVSRDMANLVPGVLKIRVEKNPSSNEYDIWAETSDQQSFSAQVLSDGTLRLLALATLRNDPHFHGTLCLEEPENGVHPLHLENMARLLREMATDFNDTQQVHEPLRQVLITTHSPLFISQPSVLDCLLLAFMPTRAGVQGLSSMKVTRMEPVITPNTQPQMSAKNDRDRAVEVYTIDTVMNYLNSRYLNKADEQLKKARTTL